MEHPAGSWFGTLNLGVSPFAHSMGDLAAGHGKARGVAWPSSWVGGPLPTSWLADQWVVMEHQVPCWCHSPHLPPFAALQTDKPWHKVVGGGRTSTTRPIWEPALFSDSRKHLFLPLLSERAGSRPRAQSPACPHWAGSGDWGQARSPVLCQTPTRHCHLQGLWARCNRVLPSAPHQDA